MKWLLSFSFFQIREPGPEKTLRKLTQDRPGKGQKVCAYILSTDHWAALPLVSLGYEWAEDTHLCAMHVAVLGMN